jgi:membrane protein DedA with SNARE-associated domain
MITLDSLSELAAVAYLVIFALAAFDVIVPILPSETAVVLGGVLAWQGRLNFAAVLAVAAVGAILGDHLAYGIGRGTERFGRAHRQAQRRASGKVQRLEAWAALQLEAHGPVVLIVARFIPGGRTASTFVSGRLRYPLALFTPVTIVAGILWAAFGSALGYLGGTTFHDNTWLATGLGVAVGTVVAFGIEMVMSRTVGRPPVAAPTAEVRKGDDDLAA